MTGALRREFREVMRILMTFACLAHPQRSEPIRTDPNRPEPTPTDSNRPQSDPLCPFWPPPLCLVEPGFQCSGCNFVFRDLTSQERAKRWQWGEYNIAIFLSTKWASTFVRLRWENAQKSIIIRVFRPFVRTTMEFCRFSQGMSPEFV